jgi:O-antigen/teichoic acid export membrane protein
MSGRAGALSAILVGGGARLAGAGIGLAGTTLAARSLGPADWGIWVMLFAGFGWCQHLAEWGLRSAALVEGGRLGRACRGLVRDILCARLVPLVLSGVLLLGGTLAWRPELAGAALCLAAALGMIALNLDWVALVRGSALPASLGLVARPASFLAAIAVLPTPLAVGDLALATLIGWAGAALAGAAEWPRAATPAPGRERLQTGKLLTAGTPFFLVTAANQVALSADLIAVAWMLGTEAAGAFGLAMTIAQTATLGAQAAAQWWLARGAAMAPARARRVLLDALLLGGTVAAALAILGPGLLLRLFDAGWTAAADLLPPSALYVALVHVTAVRAALVAAAGGAGRVALVQLLSQAIGWPLQLLAAARLGLESVVLLRGLVELLRLVLLAGPGDFWIRFWIRIGIAKMPFKS